MTDTEAALLRAIAAQPHEDTPRLIYADYLDEEGAPAQVARAELIRLSVQLERMNASHPDREDIRQRVCRLLYRWDVVWQTELPPGFTRLAFYCRGFPYRAALTASLAAGADDPRLLLIEYLELTPDVTARQLAAVLKWPIFGRVTELVLRGHGLLNKSGAAALAGGMFPKLVRLRVQGQQIGDRGLAALGTSSGFPRLRELDVSYNGVSAAARQAFGRSPLGARLERVFGGGEAAQ
ncbi:TIGR02996 domain-containing protein [Gemmata sp. JC673]|uniref:TIGR02996 domain-containing protein n=1 Tax=Gemmata algarum TaxID=2975278 RepID=A0ABU5F4Z0_9BACT|nr:TIGR02996 domain-containing protein [Gemmata algarum]MDY3562627.1 TIGR02996 domain-containing protein [Gemmata algarum]